MTESFKKWGHDELQEDLASHLRSTTDRIVWTDIQMGPSGTYRPDVFCMPKSYANFHPVVYEVKVSLSDFRSDVTSGKWHNYLKVAQAVIFAMPAGFINKQDVPPGCGLIIRYEGGWKMVKKPTMTALETLPREAWLKLLISGIEWEGARVRKELATKDYFNRWRAYEALAKKYGSEIGKLLSDRDRAEERLRSNIQATQDAIEREQARRADQLKAIHADDAAYSELKRELCELIGADPNLYGGQLKIRLRNFIQSLSADNEIARLNMVLANVKNSVDNAMMTGALFEKAGK